MQSDNLDKTVELYLATLILNRNNITIILPTQSLTCQYKLTRRDSRRVGITLQICINRQLVELAAST